MFLTQNEEEDSLNAIIERGPRRAGTEVFNRTLAPRRRATIEIPRMPQKDSEFGSTDQGSLPSKATLKKKLCDFCQTTIIAADRKSGMHHSDYEELERSVSAGCTMCLQLHEDICASQLDPETLIWPLYRWNIISPQRSGDTEEIYAALVFRQAVSMVSRSDADVDPEVDFPERTFLLFQQRDSALMQPAEPLGKSTFSPQTQQTVRTWLEDCRQNHPDCQGRADKDFMPTRLLDVSRDEDRVYVVNTSVSQIKEVYVTLSYCWGRHLPTWLLRRDNKDKLMQEGVPMTELSHTIRESVIATRALGVRYIWVDSLCIVQGDASDWECEAPLMLHVYRNSVFNIAAADSYDNEGGIFRERDPVKLLDAEFQGRPNSVIFGNNIWRVVPKLLWDREVVEATLNTRAWVFQERLLSPRLLHFTRNQVFWDCATTSACETFPNGLPQPLDTGATDRYWRWKLQDTSDLGHFLPTLIDGSLELFWRNAVRRYTGCHLTVNSDKLMAIWGIASFLISALRETYGVGLWERNLEEQLAWRVVRGQQGQGYPPERRLPLRAPSWSWVSIDAIIDLPDRFAAVRDYQVVDHYGRPITFALASEQGKTSSIEEPRTWTEQLKQYRIHLARLDEQRKEESSRSKDVSQTQKQSWTGTDTRLSSIPHLLEPSIAIWGHIGRAILYHTASGRDWSLNCEWHSSAANSSAEGAVIEAYPDAEPLDDDLPVTLFLLLAMNKVYDETLPAREVSMKKQEVSYSGIGLLIEYAGTSGNFYRKGAFQFRGLSLRSLRRCFIKHGSKFGIQGEYDEALGHKLWLV